MEPTATLKQQIKDLVIANLMLCVPPEQITDDLPLFGPGGLGLDSVDALQLVVALDKTYGLKIADPAMAREVLQSITSMAAAVAKHTGTTAT